MATMHTAGKLVAIRILPEIYHNLNLEISDINSFSGIQFQDKVVNKENLINAILVNYLSGEKTIRRKRLVTCLRVVEGMLAAAESKPEDDSARIHIPSHLTLEPVGDEAALESVELPRVTKKKGK